MSSLSSAQQVAKARAAVAASLHEQLSRLIREFGGLELPQQLTPQRLSVLAMIDRRGPVSIAALADHEMVRPPTMSRMVSVLVDGGLVKRSADERDGRGVLLAMTPKGRRIYQHAHERRLRYFAEALERLNEQELFAMRTLTTQLERFRLKHGGKR